MAASHLSHEGEARPTGSLSALRRFARRPGASHERADNTARLGIERCELCGEVIPSTHRHLLELSNRELVCVCQACSLLFTNTGAAGGKYKLLPQRYLFLPDFSLTEEQWEELRIPVNMAFLFRSSGAKPVQAFYPSPAGAVESLLDLQGWSALAAANPILDDLEPDVEALLMYRVDKTHSYYIVPIDECYSLVGLIRSSWRGLSGGTEVWEAIAAFFAHIRSKSQTIPGGEHARSEF